MGIASGSMGRSTAKAGLGELRRESRKIGTLFGSRALSFVRQRGRRRRAHADSRRHRRADDRPSDARRSLRPTSGVFRPVRRLGRRGRWRGSRRFRSRSAARAPTPAPTDFDSSSRPRWRRFRWASSAAWSSARSRCWRSRASSPPRASGCRQRTSTPSVAPFPSCSASSFGSTCSRPTVSPTRRSAHRGSEPCRIAVCVAALFGGLAVESTMRKASGTSPLLRSKRLALGSTAAGWFGILVAGLRVGPDESLRGFFGFIGLLRKDTLDYKPIVTFAVFVAGLAVVRWVARLTPLLQGVLGVALAACALYGVALAAEDSNPAFRARGVSPDARVPAHAPARRRSRPRRLLAMARRRRLRRLQSSHPPWRPRDPRQRCRRRLRRRGPVAHLAFFAHRLGGAYPASTAPLRAFVLDHHGRRAAPRSRVRGLSPRRVAEHR